MEDQIKERAGELQKQFNNFGKQLQELIAQKANLEQQITITKENMLQIKGAHAELTALIGVPAVPDAPIGKKKPTKTIAKGKK